MYRGLLISSGFHVAIVMVSILALPFVAKKPLDIPPLISVELIQIAEKTNIPFAPKASKIIEKAKKENEKLLSEQAPPKKVKKRASLLAITLLVTVVGIFFILQSLNKNILYFKSPTDIKNNQNINFDKKIRVGGMVKKNKKMASETN